MDLSGYGAYDAGRIGGKELELQLIIINESSACIPVVEDSVTWETTRTGCPGILRFTCIDDGKLHMEEGNMVQLRLNGEGVFRGIIFKKSMKKEHHIEVTAYDQLRYFKNKDTYIYLGKTAGQLLQMISTDFYLETGVIENTGYAIPMKIEKDKTLFDIQQNALDDTLMHTRQLYVLFDDFGKLSLRNIENMRLDLLIDEETGENFDYTSSIDEQTYNQIKLTFDNADTGKREVYMVYDGSNIEKWGILQYYEALGSPEGAQEKVDALLNLYNAKTRNLKIENAFGDIRARAGASVLVNLNLGDIRVKSYMLIEKANHKFSKDSYTMNLTLRGAGEFIA